MQLNQSLFMLGGSSGYVPQPDLMRDDAFDPFEKDSLNVEPITIQLQVCSGPRGSISVEITSLVNFVDFISSVLLWLLVFSCIRCWEPATCLKMAAALCAPLWRWRYVGLIMTAANAKLTLWVRKLLPHGLDGFML